MSDFDIAYSSLTDCYYVVIGKEKHDITDFVKGKIQQGREDERSEWECATAELLIKYAGDIYKALPDQVAQIRADAIDEFAEALKKKYPLMYNEFGMEFNTNIHQHIDEIAEQIKEQTDGC